MRATISSKCALRSGGSAIAANLVAVAELDRALQPHAAELAGWPGDGEHGRLEAAAGHRKRAQAIALAQDDA